MANVMSVIKIVHVVPFFGEQLGGSERFVWSIVKYQMNDLSLDITILTTTRFKQREGTIKVTNNVTIIRTYAPISIWNINPLSWIFTKLLQLDVNILHIHSHLYFTSNQAVLFGLMKRIPIILHLHGGVGLPPYSEKFMKKFVKMGFDKTIGMLSFKLSTIILSVSRDDLKKIDQFKKKLLYIPNGIDFVKFKVNNTETVSRNCFTFLYVGDLEEWKGLDKICEFLTYYKPEQYISFRFIGQGKYFKKLENLKTDPRIKIETLGQIEHNLIPEQMRLADCLIFPSKWEGLPTVVLEAMAMKLPIIATPVGDLKYIFNNGENAIIIENFKESLKSAVEKIVNSNFEYKRKMAEYAWEIGKICYDIKKIAKKITKLYQILELNNHKKEKKELNEANKQIIQLIM